MVRNVDKKVSIVIASHNFIDSLITCIKKVDEHTERELLEEVVVVDNGSEHTYTFEELRELTSLSLSLIHLETNTSFAYANNRGAQTARGCYLCFMNNDIEVLEKWLEPLYEIIDNEERIGAVGPKMIFPDGSIQFAGYERDPHTQFQRHRWRGYPSHLFPEANVAGPVSALTGACLLVKKENAYFDERYWYGCEDVDLCVRLKQQGTIIYYQPKSVVIHREGTTRCSGSVVVEYERNRELFRQKWGRGWEELLWKVVT